MEVVSYVVNLPRPTARVALEPFSCIHVGNINMAEKKFLERRDAVKSDPLRLTLGMVDYGDSIMAGANQMTDKRYNTNTIDPRFPTPDDQYRWVRTQFEPIKGKLLGLLEGNHDYALEEKTGHQYVRELAEDLSVPYLGYAAFIILDFRYQGKSIRRSRIFAAHSHFNGTTVGGNMNNLIRISGFFDADVYLTAHTHRTAFDESLVVGIEEDGVDENKLPLRKNAKKSFLELSDNKYEIVKRPKIVASTGAFMETYVKGHLNYGEKNLLPALKTGTITIEFDPANGKIHAHK